MSTLFLLTFAQVSYFKLLNLSFQMLYDLHFLIIRVIRMSSRLLIKSSLIFDIDLVYIVDQNLFETVGAHCADLSIAIRLPLLKSEWMTLRLILV